MIKILVSVMAVLLTQSVLVFGGIEWQSKSSTKIEGKENTMVTKGLAQNGNVREEILDAGSAGNGINKKGSYYLYKGTSSKVIMVDTEEKTYTEMSLDDMMGAMNQIIQIKVSNPKVTVTKLADETVLTYPCKHIKIASSYDMEMKIAFINTKSHVDQTQEVWGTDKIGSKDFAKLFQNKSIHSGMKELDAVMEKQMAAYKNLGFSLKTITTQNTSDASDPKKIKTTTINLTVDQISEKALSEDLFKVPADYKKTELLEGKSKAKGTKTGASSSAAEEKPAIKAEDLLKMFK
jgi:hypothetical protein